MRLIRNILAILYLIVHRFLPIYILIVLVGTILSLIRKRLIVEDMILFIIIFILGLLYDKGYSIIDRYLAKYDKENRV